MVGLTFLLFPRGASAEAVGVFHFSSAEGFDRCLSTQRLIETVKTADGEQSRVVKREEIIDRCMKAAESFAGGSDVKPKQVIGLIKTAWGHVMRPETLGLVQSLVKKRQADCNQIDVYTTVLKGLSFSRRDRPSRHYRGSESVIRTCLSDKMFRKDIFEEVENADKNIANNVCSILKTAKQKVSCKISEDE